MPEFLQTDIKDVKPEEPIYIFSKCTSPFEVSAGIIFKSDGIYRVRVDGRKITVSMEGE